MQILLFLLFVWCTITYAYVAYLTYGMFKEDPPETWEDLAICVMVTLSAPISLPAITIYFAYQRYKEEHDVS